MVTVNTTQDILNLLLATGFLIITICFVYITYYLVQALKSITDLTENIKDKIQMKALAAVPAALIALASKVLKRRR